ncbi:MAG: hypothetical protein ACLP62_09085 [Acidimicrobiales bacterium]
MRNLWKGLVVGGLTGVAAGIVVDLGESGWQSIGRAARKAQRNAPVAAGRMKATAASESGLAASTAGRLADKVNGNVAAGRGA